MIRPITWIASFDAFAFAVKASTPEEMVRRLQPMMWLSVALYSIELTVRAVT